MLNIYIYKLNQYTLDRNNFVQHYTYSKCSFQGIHHLKTRVVFKQAVKLVLITQLLSNALRSLDHLITVKILKIGTPEIITIIVLQLEQLDFTVQYCVQKMQTE